MSAQQSIIVVLIVSFIQSHLFSQPVLNYQSSYGFVYTCAGWDNGPMQTCEPTGCPEDGILPDVSFSYPINYGHACSEVYDQTGKSAKIYGECEYERGANFMSVQIGDPLPPPGGQERVAWGEVVYRPCDPYNINWIAETGTPYPRTEISYTGGQYPHGIISVNDAYFSYRRTAWYKTEHTIHIYDNEEFQGRKWSISHGSLFVMTKLVLPGTEYTKTSDQPLETEVYEGVLTGTQNAHIILKTLSEVILPGTFTITHNNKKVPDCESVAFNSYATLYIVECFADWNSDHVVNVADFTAYLNDWNTGILDADLNDDGQVNSADFIQFINAWTSGCTRP